MANIQTINNPAKVQRNATIAQLSISGKTCQEIGNEVNLHKSQVSRILRDDQCKEILDHVMRVNIAHAKGINKQFLQMCYPDKDGNVDRKIQLDAIKQYQKNVGITPSHATNQFIFNILNQGGSIQFGPAVHAVLDSVIDIEPLPEGE